jgi:mRNA interferase MazF
MRRGDVRWYTFDRPDKSRPVVILSRDSIIPHIGEVTVAPVTSTIRDIPSEVLLDQNDGVAKACAVNCDHLQTIAKRRVGSLLTRLSTARMREVRNAVTFALSLNE